MRAQESAESGSGTRVLIAAAAASVSDHHNHLVPLRSSGPWQVQAHGSDSAALQHEDAADAPSVWTPTDAKTMGRPSLVTSFSDLMAVSDRNSEVGTGRSSSLTSNMEHLESILSPSLPSFDFDDEDSSSSGGSSDAAAEDDIVQRRMVLKERPQWTRSASNGGRGSVRTNRSLTIGSFDSHRPHPDATDNGDLPPPPHVLHRMMHPRTLSRDLWHAGTNSKFHTVARSILFSMQLKREHIYDHFFVTGLTIGSAERAFAARSPTGLAGYWKPRLLYEYPPRAKGAPDAAVADFCFPLGVPVVSCKPHEVEALQGAVVSQWSIDAEKLIKHTLAPFRTSGYTFRLTGAKGEVMYGFCVAVLGELHETAEVVLSRANKDMSSSVTSPRSPKSPRSPRSDWSKRASCPAVAVVGDHLIMSPSPKSKRKDSNRSLPSVEDSGLKTMLAPRCYCVTSKFPFYRFQFELLRMVIENEMKEESHQKSSHEEFIEFEVRIRSRSELVFEFGIRHEENLDSDPASDINHGGGLGSIASGLHVASDKTIVLSEDSTTITHGTDHHELSKAYGPPHLRKWHSSDDISTYSYANGCIVEKPVVKAIGDEANLSNETKKIRVGDILETVSGISTGSMMVDETLELIEKAEFPLKLRFRRMSSLARENGTSTSPAPKLSLSPSSVDILQRAREFKIHDPGKWSSVRLPNVEMKYQFPKRNAERWSCGVVLRFLVPESVVQILAVLLLEQQVVIMGDSPAKVSAICTALMLLLAPFQWQSTYIPLLPSGLLDFLHSPVPFLVGCHPLDDTSDWPDVCFYNIDTNQIKAPISLPHVDHTSIPHGDEFCRLLRVAQERFRALRPMSKPWYELTDDEDKIILLTMQEAQIFLRDLCCDVSEMGGRLSSETSDRSFYGQIQEEIAREARKSDFEGFLDEFCQTQLFCQYCETVLRPLTPK